MKIFRVNFYITELIFSINSGPKSAPVIRPVTLLAKRQVVPPHNFAARSEWRPSPETSRLRHRRYADHKNIPCKNSSPEAGLFLSCKNICLSQIGSRAKNISCKTAIAAHMLTFLPSQRAHQDWHQAAFHGAISSGQHYGCSFDTDGDRLDSHAIIAKEEDTVVCSRL